MSRHAVVEALGGLRPRDQTTGDTVRHFRHRPARSRALITSTALSALMLSAGQAAAADASSTLEEIVVTAQKRTERLQDVPVAVTAISGDVLSERQIDDATLLTQLVPSLTFAQGNAANNNNMRVRGIGTAVFSVGVESSVSTVVDGVVLARQTQGFADLADIERIEVLRGPQGTLFGKNATAGVVNVVTKRPSAKLTASAQLTLAEGDEQRMKASVSGPITDTIRARVSAYYNDVGGHFENITLKQDVNGFSSFGGRARVEWDATEKLNVLFTADYKDTNSHCCASFFTQVDNPVLAALTAPIKASPGNRKVIDNRASRSTTQQELVAMEANWTFDAFTLTSITGYQHYHTLSEQPVDRLNTPRPIFITPGSGQLDINDGTINIRQSTQEFRITSPADERLSYVLGVYYLNLDADRFFKRRTGTCVAGGANGPAVVGAFCNAPVFSSTFAQANTKTENYSLFGQADFKLTKQLSLIGGLRWQTEDVSYYGIRPAPQVLFPGDAVQLPFAAGGKTVDDTAITGKVGVQYRFSPRAQTYVTYSTGYKGAGWGTELGTDFTNQTPALKETVKAYEVGYKAQLFDNRMSFNAAAFRSDFKGQQIQATLFDPLTGISTTVLGNAGSATVQGIETELTAKPIRRLTISGGLTYLKSTFDADGLSCPLQAQATPIVIPLQGAPPINQCFRRTATGILVQNVRDGDLPNAPKWRGTLSVRYDDRLLDTKWFGFAQASVTAQSDYSYGLTQDPLDHAKGYGIVDLNFGARSPDGRYAVTLYVKNLTDQHFLGSEGPAPALTSPTLTPTNRAGIAPKEASRYVGATFAVTY